MEKEDVVYVQWNTTQTDIQKRMKFAICNNMDGSRGYYAQWNYRKTNSVCYHLHVESKKIKQKNENNKTNSQGTNSGYEWGEGKKEGQDRVED